MLTFKIILGAIGATLCFSRAIWLLIEIAVEREEQRDAWNNDPRH
jgi:hypothetical protein